MIFLEIQTRAGTYAINASDITEIHPQRPTDEGLSQCYIVTPHNQFMAIGKSYEAILGLLRASGATLITAKSIPQAPRPL